MITIYLQVQVDRKITGENSLSIVWMIIFELIVALKLLIVTFYVIYAASGFVLDEIFPIRHPAGETTDEHQHHFYLLENVLQVLNLDNNSSGISKGGEEAIEPIVQIANFSNFSAEQTNLRP